MFRPFSIFLWITFFSTGYSYCQPLNNVAGAFAAIPATPLTLKFVCKGHKIPGGGHLQGISGYSDNGVWTFVVTASSATQSYYLTIKNGKTTGLTKLFDNPYRHAGGCQVANDILAVGIEDNMAKDKSKVVLRSMRDSGFGNIDLVAQRQGMFKRSTAGATGIVETNDKRLLIAVADWDSRNIDFYVSERVKIDSVGTYRAPDTSGWGSYQSINLLTDTGGNVFMVGFCRKGSVNRADLFKMEQSANGIQLTPVNSRIFTCTNGAGFRYGAGLKTTRPNSLSIYTTQRRLKRVNRLNIFAEISSN